MATSALIPIAEYLRSSYRPDCDYVDGEVQERNLGEQDHSDLQSRLIELLLNTENKPYVRANPELRVQVKATRFRVPDVCVRARSAPSEQIVRKSPLLCIEILSPEDTVLRTRERVLDFLEMGVPEVWILDPERRSVTVCAGLTMVEHTHGTLSIPKTPVELGIADIFIALDDYDSNSGE
jgi:Uma2 family endonuclease